MAQVSPKCQKDQKLPKIFELVQNAQKTLEGHNFGHERNFGAFLEANPLYFCVATIFN